MALRRLKEIEVAAADRSTDSFCMVAHGVSSMCVDGARDFTWELLKCSNS